MTKIIKSLVLVLVLVSCGKNDAFVSSPYGPAPGQAPMPPGGYPYNPNYGQPGYPGQYPGQYNPGYPGQQPGYPGQYPGVVGQNPGGFNPQLPQGYPQQYTPFLPIDQAMRQNPQLNQYWQQYWNQWTNDCGQQWGCNQYDFSRFWYEYCPQQWQHTQMAPIYNYIDTTFYYWAQPGMNFGSYDPGNFWMYYSGTQFCNSCY